MDSSNDKLSIKNLLFKKALPNYEIPIPTNGHKLYCCTDCGDKFILESSYEYHINRKSVQISYHCRYCSQMKIFYNRCNFLSHIRSHAFKTATINVVDLKVEPLPLSFFESNVSKDTTVSKNNEKEPTVSETEPKRTSRFVTYICFECKKDITDTGVVYKDRAKHYMEYTNKTYACPVCMFNMPTACGLQAHLRIHLRCPPYFCAECGVHLSVKNTVYPYIHDCEGFKMMRATSRFKCSGSDCPLLHPNVYNNHIKETHLKKVYKCPFCFVACFNEDIMTRHLKTHKADGKAALIYWQCNLCPSKLILQNQVVNHVKTHSDGPVYPCWTCGPVFADVNSLITHHKDNHNFSMDDLKNKTLTAEKEKRKRIYRVVKRCDQCKRSFTYKCKFEQITLLPKECPYKCLPESGSNAENQSNASANSQIICHICRNNVPESWEHIKKHYAIHHKSYQCVDINILVERLDLRKYLTEKKNKKIRASLEKRRMRKSNKQLKNMLKKQATSALTSSSQQNSNPPSCSTSSELSCSKCNDIFNNKEQLEKHLISHRDPCMAYQCMECGQSFVVKPSFSTHLLIEHGISDVEEYISKKECYNETALLKYQHGSVSIEPLRENQCKICREQFNAPDELEKHFRVHGMAFLLKNNSNKSNSP